MQRPYTWPLCLHALSQQPVLKHSTNAQPLPVRAAADMFTLLADARYRDLQLHVSCFEIYGGKLYDLLNGRKRLEIREDGKKRVCIVGLKEFVVEEVMFFLGCNAATPSMSEAACIASTQWKSHQCRCCIL